ncbi:MAG: NAD(P)-binding protein [Pseudomonadota bacterium]
MKTPFSDKSLGMDRQITRRDLLHGASVVAAGAALLPNAALASIGAADGAPYPPSLTGLRGNHDGSFEVAHELGREGRTEWGAPTLPEDSFDLVVVGAGLSGLAAAHFYLREHPERTVLILDNHDDFGGHAKRNEFTVNGRTLISYGGSQTLPEPSSFSAVVKGLLSDIGVNLKRFETAYDQDFYRRNGLRAGIHFDKKDWGIDRTVAYDFGYFEDYLPLSPNTQSASDAVAQMPLSAPAKKEFIRLLTGQEDLMPQIKGDEKWEYLYNISYKDFLANVAGVKENGVFRVLETLTGDAGARINAITALTALNYSGLPGWEAAGLPEIEPAEAYIHHFPDGNASIARLLVRSMIPDAAAAGDMEDLLTTPFDYSKLDSDDAQARLRLNSTVVNVSHDGDYQSSDAVMVSYVRAGKGHKVKAKHCILACNHSMIPHLCPELPDAQREALSFQERAPILYTNVALTNWRAWKEMGIGAALSPESFYIHSKLDFPVSLGDYSFAESPDDPVVVHMEHFPNINVEDMPVRQRHQLGRFQMLTTPFETIERETRAQLASFLGGAGFDPAEDIQGITVNRWAHGYSYFYNPLFDDVHDDWDDERHPHMRARKPHGRITIANSDAGASALFYTAVEEAHRAVEEIS